MAGAGPAAMPGAVAPGATAAAGPGAPLEASTSAAASVLLDTAMLLEAPAP